MKCRFEQRKNHWMGSRGLLHSASFIYSSGVSRESEKRKKAIFSEKKGHASIFFSVTCDTDCCTHKNIFPRSLPFFCFCLRFSFFLHPHSCDCSCARISCLIGNCVNFSLKLSKSIFGFSSFRCNYCEARARFWNWKIPGHSSSLSHRLGGRENLFSLLSRHLNSNLIHWLEKIKAMGKYQRLVERVRERDDKWALCFSEPISVWFVRSFMHSFYDPGEKFRCKLDSEFMFFSCLYQHSVQKDFRPFC